MTAASTVSVIISSTIVNPRSAPAPLPRRRRMVRMELSPQVGGGLDLSGALEGPPHGDRDLLQVVERGGHGHDLVVAVPLTGGAEVLGRGAGGMEIGRAHV